MTWKRHNEISDLMVKCLKWLGTFSLYLICVYWATEAVIKYLDEPSSTAIQYSFGEDGKVPNFPAITFCDPELTYPNSLVSECGIKLGNTLYNAILRIARNFLETKENIKISTHPFYHVNLD